MADQIVNVFIIKMKFFYIINNLGKSGTYRISPIVRVLPVEQVEDNAFAGSASEISLHHCEFIKIREKSKISIVHGAVPP